MDIDPTPQEEEQEEQEEQEGDEQEEQEPPQSDQQVPELPDFHEVAIETRITGLLTNSQLIWAGFVEWFERISDLSEGNSRVQQEIFCEIGSNVVGGRREISGIDWPPKLTLHLIPRNTVDHMGAGYFMDARVLLFRMNQADVSGLRKLIQHLSSGYAGLIQFSEGGAGSDCWVRVLVLLYSVVRGVFIGFVPRDQVGFDQRVETVLRQQRSLDEVIRRRRAQLSVQGHVHVPPFYVPQQQSGDGDKKVDRAVPCNSSHPLMPPGLTQIHNQQAELQQHNLSHLSNN